MSRDVDGKKTASVGITLPQKNLLEEPTMLGVTGSGGGGEPICSGARDRGNNSEI